jgi:dihydroorotase-like cyclic amidohydrolase
MPIVEAVGFFVLVEGLPMTTRRLPGLTDVHVHLREPGGEHKETFETGTAAAVAGGVTTVLAMPNTDPPLTDETNFNLAVERAQAGARCDWGIFLGGTEVNAGRLSMALQARAAGLKLYVNDTFGQLRIEALPAMLRHFATWHGPGPIVCHAEGLMVPAVIALAEASGQRLHLAHISRAAEIAVIRSAKARGVAVTCEVTPHHLWLTEDDLPRLGPFGDMRPRLATVADRAALWEGIDDGTVDCVASDHAPHTRAEKNSDQPPPGVPGLETTLLLLLTAVRERRLTIERLIELTDTAPRQIFNLPAQPETWVSVDLDAPRMLAEEGWRTKADWSPFAGLTVRGRVLQTVLRGQVLFDGHNVLATPGHGRNVRT